MAAGLSCRFQEAEKAGRFEHHSAGVFEPHNHLGKQGATISRCFVAARNKVICIIGKRILLRVAEMREPYRRFARDPLEAV